jgi:membrane protein involved in colicin uptake
MSKLIVNCETGKVVERELNAEELAQFEIDQAVEIAHQAANEARKAAEAEAKAAEEAAKQQAFNDAVAAAVAEILAAQQTPATTAEPVVEESNSRRIT